MSDPLTRRLLELEDLLQGGLIDEDAYEEEVAEAYRVPSSDDDE
jgi:hypothetical protein